MFGEKNCINKTNVVQHIKNVCTSLYNPFYY